MAGRYAPGFVSPMSWRRGGGHKSDGEVLEVGHHMVSTGGVNRNPILFNPYKIPLLRLGYGKILILIHTNLGEFSPLDVVGTDMEKQNPNSITYG